MAIMEFLLPTLIAVITGIGSALTLRASETILSDDGDTHLGYIPYSFSIQTKMQALLYGGLLGIASLYLLPLAIGNAPIFHWIPLVMISLLTAQTFIDLKYFELADEWSMFFGVLSLLWVHNQNGVTMEHVWGTLGLFVVFYVSWFFADFPGFGDVKLVLAGGVLLSGWLGVYQFLVMATLLGVVGTLLGCMLDKVPTKEWLKTKFAFGPYLVFAIVIALAGAY